MSGRKKTIDKATNKFLPQHFHFCGKKMSIFCVPSVTVSAQTVAQKSLNEFLPLRINFLVPHLWLYPPRQWQRSPWTSPCHHVSIFWCPIYSLFFRPDIGTEVPERVPATTYQFFGAPSMAFVSARTLAQKSLNEFLPLYINFLGSHLWRFLPRQWDISPWTSSCHQMFIFGAPSMAFFSAQTVGQKSLNEFL